MYILPLQNALLFIVQTIFSVYVSIVLFRLILQAVRADFYSPLAQFVVKATNPLLLPLRKIIPGFAGIDWASVVLALFLQASELMLIRLIKGFSLVEPTILSISGLFIWAIGELIDTLLVIFLFATLIQVIMSWFQPGGYNPNLRVLEQVTDPLIRPVRRLVPMFGMLDFSPLVVVFLISLTRKVFAENLMAIGYSLI